MPKVRLSGTVHGADDPNRSSRARLLYLLYAGGWDIYNSNGDQRITLANIEKKIVESDAFVFTPGATIEDMFKAVSIFVGYQTLDRNLSGKPTVVLNSDGSWNPLFAMLAHLQKVGAIRQNVSDYLMSAETPEHVLELLESFRAVAATTDHAPPEVESDATVIDTPLPEGYIGSACVFCSATLMQPTYLEDGEACGRMLAENGIGCVSGAGRSGIMGAVVRGAVEAGGWAGGSNVPHIIQLEGLPDGLSSFWLRPDIYTRMEVMIERSEAFLIFPGGAGTVQELLALLIFKRLGSPVMYGKPIVIFNRADHTGQRFWDPLIDLLSDICDPGDFLVAKDFEDLLPGILPGMSGGGEELAELQVA